MQARSDSRPGLLTVAGRQAVLQVTGGVEKWRTFSAIPGLVGRLYVLEFRT